MNPRLWLSSHDFHTQSQCLYTGTFAFVLDLRLCAVGHVMVLIFGCCFGRRVFLLFIFVPFLLPCFLVLDHFQVASVFLCFLVYSSCLCLSLHIVILLVTFFVCFGYFCFLPLYASLHSQCCGSCLFF